MRAAIALFIMLLAVIATAAEPPRVPLANQIARHEHEQPVFRYGPIPKEQGDALPALPDGGGATERRMKDRPPPEFTCVSQLPPRFWMNVILTNGMTCGIGFPRNDELLCLPKGLYKVTDAASKPIAGLMAELEADLRRKVVGAPRPCVYKIGAVDDGGAL